MFVPNFYLPRDPFRNNFSPPYSPAKCPFRPFAPSLPTPPFPLLPHCSLLLPPRSLLLALCSLLLGGASFWAPCSAATLGDLKKRNCEGAHAPHADPDTRMDDELCSCSTSLGVRPWWSCPALIAAPPPSASMASLALLSRRLHCPLAIYISFFYLLTCSISLSLLFFFPSLSLDPGDTITRL